MRRHRIVGRLGLAAAIIAAAATSCSTSGSAAEANGACDTPGISTDQVKLGLVFSSTGTGSEALASARSGFDARIGLANANGGVHGREVTYVWRDDESTGAVNEQATVDLVHQESVFGLVMVTSSNGQSPETLQKEGVPVVGLAQPDYGKYSNWFTDLYDPSPATVARYMLARGGTKLAIVTTGSSDYVMGFAHKYGAEFQQVGLPTVEVIPFEASTDSPSRIAKRIAASGADALIGFTTLDDFAQISAAVTAADVSLKVSVSLSGYDRSTLSRLGQQLVGVSFPVYFHPFEGGGEAIDRYHQAMSQYAPETAQPEQQFAVYAYIYADMFLRGLELAGECPTREGFISALRAVKDFDASGLIEPVDLSTNQTTPLRCNAFVQIDPTGAAFQVVQPRLCVDGTT
ncbi:amino acid-binding protein [Frankia sp. CcI49]|uniref:ABC transporter substrate-binding protein n=1 Tax=unclassified Frankia TaxID=2632575 RepID=UPI0006CA04D5|nr:MULTISPECIES: ABC transporter substrate-binding protein [unclassified Frankia]KPM51102.1 amino acid-binding protein [Frankia sp. R43]ONH60682.1 amino acid-binding protein [Frankia sp. CcI49]